MPTQIQRCASASSSAVTFAASVQDSSTICMSTTAAFSVIVADGVTSTSITWHASHRDDGPYYPVIMSNGSPAATVVTAGRVFVAPPELFACMYVRGVAGIAFSAMVVGKT